MSEKINLQDFTALLAEKSGISKKEAEAFLRECFEVIDEELVKDKLLKIKDLGTFKLLPVEDRESVDVATGERVLIPAHYKVTFTADKNLAQTVNEPFAFFETVEVNNDAIVDEPEDLSENESEEEETVDVPINEVPFEEESKEESKEEIEEKPVKKKRKVILIPILILALLLLGSLIAGVLYITTTKQNPQQLIVAPIPEPEIQAEKADSFVVAEDTTITESPVVEAVKTFRNKERTLLQGERLTLIALKEYGNKIFWIYLYEENKDIIENPNIVTPGLIIRIPPASKYNIDKDDQTSIDKAQALIDFYKK
jgi:nucleoid DNA-binding protein/predicted nucleic acid-binding Zn ribbon protein